MYKILKKFHKFDVKITDKYLVITNVYEIIYVNIIFTSPTYIIHLLWLILIFFY